MRSLAFTSTGAEYWNQLASLCCSCGLCTLYACPEELYPKEACDDSKAEMRKSNLKWSGKMEVKPHAMREGRRVPIKSLMRKMHILQYDHPAHLEKFSFQPKRAIILLKQNAGSPNLPLAKAGDRVSAGQQIGEIPEKAMGAIIHAPFASVVETVTDKQIILNRA
jgi:Na+-translocating ferredoxin:NAD+ oxidoreductase RnfC subunit